MALKRSFFSILGVGTAIGLKSDGRTLADLRRDNPILARSDPGWPDFGRSLFCPHCELWIGDPDDPDETVADVSVDHDLGKCERAIEERQYV